jgi:flagellar basal-body rod protein FlgB
MAISQLPIFSMLRSRMHWHQERQGVLAENVANADTPKFRPNDLVPIDPKNPQPNANLTLARTDSNHLTGLTGGTTFNNRKGGYEVRPSANAVNLEDEMMKVAANQMDYQAATTLYAKSVGLLKTAIGRR